MLQFLSLRLLQVDFVGRHVLLMDGIVGYGLCGRREGYGGVIDGRGVDQRRLYGRGQRRVRFDVKVYEYNTFCVSLSII